MRSLQNPAPIMAMYMAAIYAQAGEVENATDLAARNIDIVKAKLVSVGAPLPESWLNFVSQRIPFKHKKDREHFLEGLRIAGVPESLICLIYSNSQGVSILMSLHSKGPSDGQTGQH